MSPRVLTSKELSFDDVFPVVDNACAMCQTPLKGKQRRWCSDKCSQDAWVEINFRRGVSGYIRKKVFARDKGICVACGADCEKIGRVFKALHNIFWEWRTAGIDPRYDGWASTRSLWTTFEGYVQPYWKVRDGQGNFWQADHIKEVAAGGEHTMENLQTLCTICHKAKTKEFVRRKDPVEQQGLFV